MAEKVANLFLADIGIGITGFNNTVPEEGFNKLFAFISIVYKNRETVTPRVEADASSGIRTVQIFYVNKAIELLNRVVTESMS